MKAVLQRTARAGVSIDGRVVSQIERGLLILLGVEPEDTEDTADALARKIAGLRIFEDESGKMNLSCEEIGGSYLVVSQFTLCADLSKGKRPGFEGAMKPPEAERLYERFATRLREFTGRPVEMGRFGKHMQVELVNDGPVTLIL